MPDKDDSPEVEAEHSGIREGARVYPDETQRATINHKYLGLWLCKLCYGGLWEGLWAATVRSNPPYK